MNSRQESSYLYDSKMELHPDEGTFASPTISIISRKAECTFGRVAKILLVIFLIIGAFVGGYLIRRAIHKNKCPSSPSNKEGELRFLKEILDEMSPVNIEDTLRNFTSSPHIAGQARNLEIAHTIHDTWNSYGFEAKLVKYNVLLSYPVEGKFSGAVLVNDSGGEVFRTAQQEEILDPSENSSNAVPPFSGYSASGIVPSADLVYVNYGRVKDFKHLSEKNISCQGKVVIARYGYVFRGDKVMTAQQYGARAILLFNDPQDFAPVPEDELYPHGWWLPRTGVQRGAVFKGNGDPLTPRYPSREGAYRINISETNLPKIPAHPISARDAEHFLRLLGGAQSPSEWRGGLNVSYNIGPGFKSPYQDWSVRVEIHNNRTRMDIHNVIGILRGKDEPDKMVLLGNHRDAWVFGGIDPSSGTACLMEIAKAFGAKYSNGWRPRRTIVLCSWGGEEYGLLGSTEWVEDNIHTLSQRAIAYLNVDSPIRGNYSLYVRASPLLHRVLFSASKQVKNPIDADQTVYDNWLEKFPSSIPRCSSTGLTPCVPSLGSGSDYAPFYLRTGVPSADLRYVFDMTKFHNISAYPMYHSIHDTFQYVKRFVDPLFTTHLAIAQVWGSVAYLLSDTPLLPINCSDYAVALKNSLRKLQNTYGEMLKKEKISLKYLEDAVDEFSSAAGKLQSMIATLDRNDPSAMRMINDRLAGLEKTFINPEGLPGRPLYWHMIYAPSSHNSYASAVFPGLSDSLIDAKHGKKVWTVVRRQLSIVTGTIYSAAQFLGSTI